MRLLLPLSSGNVTETRTSSVQQNSSLARIVLLNIGSTGNSAMRRPIFVNSPRSFKAPSAYSSSSARIKVSPGGGSINSKPIRSLIPRDLRSKTTMPRLVRWISGVVFSSSSLLYAHLVYSRKAFPGPTRPARPARWLADALEHSIICISQRTGNETGDTYGNNGQT